MSQDLDTYAEYLAIRHLSHKDAARFMGKDISTIRAYRRRYRELQPDAVKAPDAPSQRDDIIKLEIPMQEPSRSVSSGGVHVMLVSLPKPPAGVVFTRQGVQA